MLDEVSLSVKSVYLPTDRHLSLGIGPWVMVTGVVWNKYDNTVLLSDEGFISPIEKTMSPVTCKAGLVLPLSSKLSWCLSICKTYNRSFLYSFVYTFSLISSNSYAPLSVMSVLNGMAMDTSYRVMEAFVKISINFPRTVPPSLPLPKRAYRQ